MNYIIYNDLLVAESEFNLNPLDRAFNYGDGLFETMIFKNGKVLFLNDHLSRIAEGLKCLDIVPPSILLIENFLSNINQLAVKNQLPSNARIKLMVWRKVGGFVTPEFGECNYLITLSKQIKLNENKGVALISENVRLYPSALSKFKTLNFLSYIQAGLEKKRKNAGEIIILDFEGNISEATSSNMFWVKSNVLFTPSIDTGCIAGVMRKQIIEFCLKESIEVREGKYSVSELESAELVFTSNVSGLGLIEKVNDKIIKTEYTIYQSIKLGLDLL